MMASFKGLSMGLISGITFGLIPLFSLPLLGGGMPYADVLFYRFLFSAALIGIIVAGRRQSLKVTAKQLQTIAMLGVMYAASAIFLQWGYTYVVASVATPIHFLYPVIVALIMGIFFGEKITLRTILAICVAILGVFLLSSEKANGHSISVAGLVIVIVSGIAYALYIVSVRHSRVSDMEPLRLTFYLFIVTTIIVYLWALCSSGGVALITSGRDIWLLLGLAIIPTVISNLTLLDAVRRVGSTTTAILGAMEPLTAVAVGVVVFGEPFNDKLIGGVAMIIVAVMLVILGRTLKDGIGKAVRFVRKRVSL